MILFRPWITTAQKEFQSLLRKIPFNLWSIMGSRALRFRPKYILIWIGISTRKSPPLKPAPKEHKNINRWAAQALCISTFMVIQCKSNKLILLCRPKRRKLKTALPKWNRQKCCLLKFKRLVVVFWRIELRAAAPQQEWTVMSLRQNILDNHRDCVIRVHLKSL